MLISLHEHFPVRITDWLLSAILFSWGVTIFFLDPVVWAMPVYDGLARFGPQMQWSAIAVGLGLVRLGALFVNGAVRRSPHLRGAGAFFSIFIWVQIALGLMTSESTGVAVAIFPWLAFADMFNVWRAARDAQISNRTAIVRRGSAALSAERT